MAAILHGYSGMLIPTAEAELSVRKCLVSVHYGRSCLVVSIVKQMNQLRGCAMLSRRLLNGAFLTLCIILLLILVLHPVEWQLNDVTHTRKKSGGVGDTDSHNATYNLLNYDNQISAQRMRIHKNPPWMNDRVYTERHTTKAMQHQTHRPLRSNRSNFWKLNYRERSEVLLITTGKNT